MNKLYFLIKFGMKNKITGHLSNPSLKIIACSS